MHTFQMRTLKYHKFNLFTHSQSAISNLVVLKKKKKHNKAKHNINKHKESNMLPEQFEIEKLWAQGSLQAQVGSSGVRCTRL